MPRRKFALAAVCCSLVAACGSEGTNNGQTNNMTSSNNATSNTTNTTTQTSNNGGSVLPMGVALAASSDFAMPASAYHALTEQAARETTFGTGDISVAVGAQWAFALDRAGERVQVLGPSFEDMGIIDVAGTGATNPNDAIDVMGKVYVSLYDVGELVVAEVSESTPNTWSVDRLELGAFDDYDQNPEPSAMASDGQYLLVVLQRLQDFVGVENSTLLVIDATDSNVTGAVDLGVTNVQAGIRRVGESFAVGATGDYGVNDGGILAITRDAAGYYAPGAMLVDEATLGGDLLDFVFVSETSGYAVITLPDFSSKLVAFEVGGAATSVDSVKSPGFGGLDLSADGRWLAVGDRDPTVQGFVVFDLDETPPSIAATIPAALAPAGFRFIAP